MSLSFYRVHCFSTIFFLPTKMFEYYQIVTNKALSFTNKGIHILVRIKAGQRQVIFFCESAQKTKAMKPPTDRHSFMFS